MIFTKEEIHDFIDSMMAFNDEGWMGMIEIFEDMNKKLKERFG